MTTLITVIQLQYIAMAIAAAIIYMAGFVHGLLWKKRNES